MVARVKIGELLAQHGMISPDQLASALRLQKDTGRKMGQLLVELGYVEEERLLDILAQQFQIPFVDINNIDLSAELVARLPETHARRLRAIVLEDHDKYYLVGVCDPTDIMAQDELAQILKRRIRLAIIKESDLLSIFDRAYHNREDIKSLAVELRDDLGGAELDLGDLQLGDEDNEAPVVRLLHSIFEDAVHNNASDIHIEPDQTVLRIRQRVDGSLIEQRIDDTSIASALVLRLKLMAGLDISERRLPQDGRFPLNVASKAYDVRLSSLPITSGESVVMRLLDQSGQMLGLDKVGMPPKVLKRIYRLIKAPHGLILVTGPTGSGKTTSLYSMLKELNVEERKIITCEDPVEYQLDRINQCQINHKINLTFASVLRSCLRQDPDVIMVGEMRDQETAEIGLRAAMTGHLVLSTLHTNDAISSSLRLIDMGAEGYLVASALKAVMAQRLVRRICEHCRAPYTPDAQELTWLGAMLGSDASSLPFQLGQGCRRCNNTGYRGRIGVYELLTIDRDLADRLRDNDASGFAQVARANPEFQTLSMGALDYALRGVTTIAEVLKISEDVEEAPSRPAAPPVDAAAIDAAAQAGAEPRVG